MKSFRFFLIRSVIVAVVLMFTGSLSFADDSDNVANGSGNVADGSDNDVIGRRVPSLVLKDSTGTVRSFEDFHARTLVVVFMGTECPIGNAYVPYLNDLQNQFKEQPVQVIGINSNLTDSMSAIAKHAKEYEINFPVLVDSNQEAADVFGAERTPEAFVLDRRRCIRYRGRIDDRFGYGIKKDQPTRADLAEAVKELVSGKPVSVATTKTAGCKITRASNLKRKGEITYTQHIAPIIHKRCAGCHHPGTAAPFSLLSFDSVRNWSAMIKETVLQRRMPPWNIDPRYGKFSNDLRMTSDEISTLVAWVDAGAPLGNPADLPQAPNFTDGWTIEKPHAIFSMPEEYTVQARGTVAYKYFVTPTNFKEDKWVRAAEARPGNRAAVHHIIVFVREKGSRRTRRLPAVVGFAPGEEPVEWPSGVGFRIPAGAELVWQVHYTPTGKVEKDRSQVGLVFHDKKPERVARTKAALNFMFKIPAGAENHKVESKTYFANDAELLTLMPHMHLRGRSFRFTAHLPDGKTQILLNVPDYDFNWQHRYRFAKPYRIPKGTTVVCEAHFDNSKENPANPDPSQPVRWGDQTWEEMMIGYISYVDAK